MRPNGFFEWEWMMKSAIWYEIHARTHAQIHKQAFSETKSKKSRKKVC